MATFKSSLYSLQNGESPGGSKAAIGDVGGRVRTISFSHTFGQAVIAINDVIKLCKLPAGARIVDAHVYITSTGTTGQFDFGWQASSDAVEAADQDGLGLGATLDSGGSAVDYRLVGSVAGFMKKFSSIVDIVMTAIEATDAATTDTINGHIAYVID